LSSIEYLGIVAGFLTSFSFVPQIVRVYKLKSAHEISLIFNTSMLLGSITWLIYGIVQGLPSLIIWNSIAVVLTGWLLFAKLKYGRVKSI
jgi:MtN3 and saliva related transmembrane protein